MTQVLYGGTSPPEFADFSGFKRPARKRPEPLVSLVDACKDANIFGPWFQPRNQWIPWFVFLNVISGTKLTKEETIIYEECTEREYIFKPNSNPFEELWMVCGRRAGKTRMMALLAVYFSCFYDWSPFLAPGERGTVALLAADRKQARTAFRYVTGFFDNVELLKDFVTRSTGELFDLRNQITD